MKKSIVFSALVLLLAVQVLAQKASEVEAIKAVIEQETKAYFGIDQKTWMESWVHTPYAYWSFVDEAGMSHYEGWKAIEIGFNDYFVTSKPSNIQIERTWLDIRVYGNGAYARFKQHVVTNGVKGPEQTEIRILEKEKNIWKIAVVGVLKKSDTAN